ncbi:MAG: hypothetical protein U1F35_18475 [Steroidobacteraceae bacterium]
MPLPNRTITFALAGAFILAIFWPLLHPPDTTVHRAVLKRQFQLLKAPSESRLIYLDEKPKLGRVLIGAYYQSSMSYDQLKHYYVPQLQRHGWALREDAGEADADRRITLCKGDYQADLEHAAERRNIGWSYSLTLSWGAQKRCPAGA